MRVLRVAFMQVASQRYIFHIVILVTLALILHARVAAGIDRGVQERVGLRGGKRRRPEEGGDSSGVT